MKATRFEVMGDDGEWHELQGVTSFEFHMEPPPADEPPDDDTWRRYDAADSLRFMWEAVAEAQRPRVIDQDGNSVRLRPDRPAWQSPYGPPTRRH